LHYNGCFAHVFSRSLEKRPLFHSDSEFECFCDLLQHSKKRFGYGVHHYCLMHTHFHLAVSMPDVRDFSLGMKWVKLQYAKRYNHARERRGPLWQARFRSLLIEDERYLRACGRYIESNPVEAGLVQKPEQWAYSSARHYVLGVRDEMVDVYAAGGDVPEMPGDIEDLYEKGLGIGSPLFLLKLVEELEPPVSVP
jgi:putative transposase